MTVYDWRNGNQPAGQLLDADGNELSRVLWADTETGEYEALRLNDRGQPYRKGDELATFRGIAKAPLVFKLHPGSLDDCAPVEVDDDELVDGSLSFDQEKAGK